MELGQLVMQLTRIDNQMAHDQNEINNYYKIQEGALVNGMSGSQLQAFPMLIAAKQENIVRLQNERKRQEQKIEDKKKELAQLKGDLKVMENMKEKDYEQYRKALNKEIDQKVEEQTQNWLQFKDKKA